MKSVLGKLAAAIIDKPHVALLNNLGGCSVLEMSVLLHDLIHSSAGTGLTHIIGPSSIMTSLDMRGFSVSIFPAEAADLKALKAATPLAAWPGVNLITPLKVVALPMG